MSDPVANMTSARPSAGPPGPDHTILLRDETALVRLSDALRGARLGILREPIGYRSDPGSADFATVETCFDESVAELRAAGAEVIDPITIPHLKELVPLWAGNPFEEESFQRYFAGTDAPFKTRAEVMASPLFEKTVQGVKDRWCKTTSPEAHYAYLKARDRLMTHVLEVMAEHRLDAIVHKAVEHTPTLIEHGINLPYVDQKGAPHIKGQKLMAHLPLWKVISEMANG